MHTGSLPCWPDCTRHIVMSERSHDTRTQAVILAGKTALGRSPCQGGAAIHPHRQSSLPARLHSAGRRVREGTQHRYTRGKPWITLIKILQARSNLHLRHYKSLQLYPERNGQRKRIVRQTKELSTITGITMGFFATGVFVSTDEEYGSLSFS